MKKWDVFVYGDVNIDLVVPGVERFPRPGEEDEVAAMETFVGGGAALFTLGVARLGLRAVFQGSVGADFYGDYIREVFKETGVDDMLLDTDRARKTGISISFTNEKDRCFLTYRGTNKGQALRNLALDEAKKARHVHVTGYAGRANHMQYLDMMTKIKRLQDMTLSFDVGWDPENEWYEGIEELFPLIDVLFMNETECLNYARRDTVREAAARFAEKAGMVVIKCGSRGAMAVRGGKCYAAEGYPVQVLDTTGAGDSFNAGFIYGYLNRLSMEDCLKCGNGCGALSVTRLGGNAGFPDEETLKRWIAAHANGCAGVRKRKAGGP
ncbi:MAG: carbohydrate kinase family protein [Christensenellaceae bacterium]|nr:carbohydrate kinase family protein [Christensenellaceae bacterium]MEA5064494.1 carbohydrate kinase family protein [Eubacteriales bacterium]MEA5068651.1 carbohydrate kinase family protein [Christensenellaceae bacterium]